MTFPRNYDDMPMNWVGDWIGKRAMYMPNREALYDAGCDQRFTFAQLNERANRVGVYLTETLGLKKGDRLCILTRNRVEAIDLYFACGKTGIILSPLSYYLQVRELEELMNRLQPEVVVYEDVFAPIANAWKKPESLKHHIEIGDDDRYETTFLAAEEKDVNVPLAMSDTFLYIHTGGTTAVPKVCVVPHRQMIWNSVETVCNGVNTSQDSTFLLLFPFFHIGGWNIITPMTHMGARTVILREFDAGKVLEVVEKEKVDAFGGVEVMFQFILASPKFQTADLSSLKCIVSGAAPCSKEVMKPFWDRGIASIQAYGLTEGGPSNFCFYPKQGSMEEIKANATKVGTPMFHCDYKLVDPDTLEEVEKGEAGVMCLRSPHAFGGYLNDYWRTERLTLEGGWIYTGDLAFEDENGEVEIIGRSDNMFISGGENVSPEEIEQILKLHNSVAACLSVGIQDERWGQIPVAMVVPRPGYEVNEEELIEFCRKNLAAFKVPKEIRAAQMIPMTGAGKPDRNALKKLFETEEQK